MSLIDWVPWIPTLITAAICLIALVVVFDVAGLGRRITPGSQEFFGRLPPVLRRLWRALVTVVAAQLVATVAAVTAAPAAWGAGDIAFRVWEADTLPMGVALGVVIIAGMFGRRRAARRAARSGSADGASSDTAGEIGRGLGKLALRVARSPQGKAALRGAGRVAGSVQRAAATPPEGKDRP